LAAADIPPRLVDGQKGTIQISKPVIIIVSYYTLFLYDRFVNRFWKSKLPMRRLGSVRSAIDFSLTLKKCFCYCFHYDAMAGFRVKTTILSEWCNSFGSNPQHLHSKYIKRLYTPGTFSRATFVEFHIHLGQGIVY
jgi:hypothetical protein